MARTQHALVAEAVVPLRGTPAHAAEQVHQLLFGERVFVLGQQDAWLQVRNETDGYEGWLPTQSVALPPDTEAWASLQNGLRVQAPLAPATVTEETHGTTQQLHLPMAAPFPYQEHDEAAGCYRLRWNGRCYSMPSSSLCAALPLTPAAVLATAFLWLNAPYQWGGRTMLGVDCSGLVQTVLQLHGLGLPRDAWQQAQATQPHAYDARQPGDLAFFWEKQPDRISHVGLLVDAETVLHASGRVRLDPYNPEGIWRGATRTHHLHSICQLPSSAHLHPLHHPEAQLSRSA